VQPQFRRLEWRFDGASPLAPEDESDAAVGWSALHDIRDTGRLSYMIDLRPGEDIAGYTLTEANATFSKMEAIGNLHQGVEVLHERESIDDLGEEFLEHGIHWHGHSAYGELVNVPMFMTWPGRVPSGLTNEETTQSIDLMPTLHELAQLPIPESAQGASLLPLLAEPHDPTSADWTRRAVFTERKNPPGEATEGTADSFVVLAGG
jgi:hypothetical protein